MPLFPLVHNRKTRQIKQRRSLNDTVAPTSNLDICSGDLASLSAGDSYSADRSWGVDLRVIPNNWRS